MKDAAKRETVIRIAGFCESSTFPTCYTGFDFNPGTFDRALETSKAGCQSARRASPGATQRSASPPWPSGGGRRVHLAAGGSTSVRLAGENPAEVGPSPRGGPPSRGTMRRAGLRAAARRSERPGAPAPPGVRRRSARRLPPDRRALAGSRHANAL
jgi:hypothetical protein